MATPESESFVRTFARGLSVIEVMGQSTGRQNMAQISEAAQLPRTVVRRLLLTLIDLGFVGTDDKDYWLTPKVLRLGWSYFDSAKTPRAAQPHLQRISIALGGAAFFAVLDEDDVVFVARDGSSQVQNVGFVLGARLSANLVAAGVAMLSCRSPQEIDQWLAGRKFVPYTPYTTTTETAVREAINTARINGYALLEQQLSLAVRGLAVPIRRRNGEIVGAISVSLPMSNESSERAIARALPLLREAEYALISAL